MGRVVSSGWSCPVARWGESCVNGWRGWGKRRRRHTTEGREARGKTETKGWEGEQVKVLTFDKPAAARPRQGHGRGLHRSQQPPRHSPPTPHRGLLQTIIRTIRNRRRRLASRGRRGSRPFDDTGSKVRPREVETSARRVVSFLPSFLPRYFWDPPFCCISFFVHLLYLVFEIFVLFYVVYYFFPF